MTQFQWDRPTAAVALTAAALCLVPTAGFLLAWHQLVDLRAFAAWAILPALALLALCEAFMVARSPLLINRLATGLLGGVAATAALDLVRVPAAYVFHAMPDHVPLIGQYYLHETVGIAPSVSATALGYGFHYLLMGALLGAAYALVAGAGRRVTALGLGTVAGLAFAALPQFRLLAVATGFDLPVAATLGALAFVAAGLVLGLVVRSTGRTRGNALRVVFLRDVPVEAGVR